MKCTHVQVGGSTGEVAISLATEFPKLHITVQDLPDTVAKAEAHLATLHSSIGSRIKLQSHDFFTPQPRDTGPSADAFLLRRILHDWPFQEALQILNHIARAMKSDAQVVILDTILPRPEDRMGKFWEAKFRVRDLTMAQIFNSGVREMGDWIEVINAVSPKLKLVGVDRPKGSTWSVLVLERVEDYEKWVLGTTCARPYRIVW